MPAHPSVLDLDAPSFRRVLGAFPTGVVAVAGLVDGVPRGLAASSFSSVSLDPPLVSVCVAESSTTWPALRTAPSLGVSVLSSGQESVCRTLSARGVDRFADLAWHPTDAGAVVLDDALAWLECSVDQQVTAGDHDIVVLRVRALGTSPHPDAEPLVVHASAFRRLDT